MTGRFWTMWRALRRAQWLPAEELRCRSEARLERLARHAVENVPFYRGLDPARLPVLDKSAYRSQPPEVFDASNLPARRRLARATSGSTGEPFRFAVDRAALPVVYASHLFYDSWLGLRPFDRYVRIVAPPAPAPGGPRLLTWAQRAYEALTQDRISVWEIDHQRAQDIWRRMEAFRPDFILGYTSTLAAIADLLERRGLKLTRRPRGVITIAETLTPERRRLIEEYFAAPITNRYGLREFGSWSAQSCAASPERFHVNTELVVCELLRQDGSEAAPGETARVVLTDLWNYARPFIRYDTGDLAAALPDPCPCGRGFPLLGSIEGRSAECLATADGKVISPAILGHYLFVYNDQARAVRCYQLVEESPGRVTLLVVPGDLWNDRSAAALRQNVAELVGPKVEVAVRSVPAIPPEPSGKRPIIKPLRLSPDAGRSVETP